jgi:hypothetical protein
MKHPSFVIARRALRIPSIYLAEGLHVPARAPAFVG